MSSLPITPPRARVDVAPKSAGPPPPSGSAGLGDFAALLTQTTSARTAPAEGQKTSRPAADDRPVRRRDEGKDDNKDAQASSATATPASDAAPAQAATGAADGDGKGAQGQPA